MTLWKPVTYYEQEYKASTNGEIVDIKTNKQVIPFHAVKGDNHLSVVLDYKGHYQTLALHRVIATTFIPNYKMSNIVHHKDFNPLNNNTDNLMWTTNEFNVALGNHRKPYIINVYSKGSNLIKTFYTKKSLMDSLDIKFSSGWKFLLSYLTKEDDDTFSMSEVVYNWLKNKDLNAYHDKYISEVLSENGKNKKGAGKIQKWVESLSNDKLNEVKEDIDKLSRAKFKTKWDKDKRYVVKYLDIN